MTEIMMSLRPEWFNPIMRKMKAYEVRKSVPLCKVPFKVYLYCTAGGEAVFRSGVIGKIQSYRMNGTVCGEFTCVGIREVDKPFGGKESGTCLTAKRLNEYAGNRDMLYYMMISDPVLYEKPRLLEEFGMSRPPQSWCYVKL